MPAPLSASRLPPTEIRSNLVVSLLVFPNSSQIRLLPVAKVRSEEKDIWPGELPAARVPLTVLAPPIVPDPFKRDPLATLTPPANEPSTVRVPWLTVVVPEKVFAPFSFRRPDPVLVRPPAPVIPLSTHTSLFCVSIVPPFVLISTVLAPKKVALLSRACRVPPLKLKALVPAAELSATPKTESVPPLRL